MTENVVRENKNIKKRLEELHKWQEEQQKVIDQRQVQQRKKLGVEQKELYNQLGIFPLEQNTNIKEQETEFNLVDIPKRKFLRRGEGLKNRFKIDPDLLRIHNLPKYKYTNAHKNNRFQSKNQQILKSNCKKQIINSSNTNQNHIVAYPISEGQHRDEEDSICESFSANQEFKYVDLSIQKEMVEVYNNNKKEKDSSENLDCEDSMIWAKVLSTYQIKPNALDAFRHHHSKIEETDDAENLSIFEMLEKKTQHGSFDINASLIKKWIQEKASVLIETSKEDEEERQIEKIENLKTPFPSDIEKKLLKVESSENSNISTLSDDNQNHSIIEDEICSETNYDHQSDRCHVRFSDEVLVNQDSSEEEISPAKSFCKWQDTDQELCESRKDNSGFEKFKANLFNAVALNNEGISNNDNTLIEQLLAIPLKGDGHRKEILEKTELLKVRLAELENEITMFRQNNSQLLRLKQEHELDKIQFERNCFEMQEKFNDEKIKYEIHLHDERLKIEEEKKKFEKHIREQKIPNKKERDEILKLKEEVEILQKELKNKESKHVAAQARLRAQIRILEKEVKETTFEIDNLKKENKKLENENARMTRQNNNKMLQEINKTISKLTVKPTEVPISTEIVHNKNAKSVVAKVISHKRKPFCKNQNIKPTNPQVCSYEKSSQSSSDNSEINYSSSSSRDENKSKYLRKAKVHHLKRMSNIEHKSNSKSLDLNGESNSKLILNGNVGSYNPQEFKREIEHPDGSKDIWYPNGNLKKISADGMNIKMLYFNKDIKETNISEGTVRYYYAEKNTWHTTYLDGLEILEFPNGQTEHRHKDGKIEVHFPNGSIRITNPSEPNKLEEWRYADGTNCIELKNGDKILSFPNGQKEIHTKIHKRREYPDGTVKIVYPDGSQETRYSNGRIRLKDKAGILIMDSENNKF